MWTALCGVCGFGLMLWAVIVLARNSGKKTAQLDALKDAVKQTAQEQERLNEIKNSIYHMPVGDVRGRLQNLERQ